MHHLEITNKSGEMDREGKLFQGKDKSSWSPSNYPPPPPLPPFQEDEEGEVGGDDVSHGEAPASDTT